MSISIDTLSEYPEADLYNGDKIVWFISTKLRWSPLRTAIVASIVFMLMIVITASINGLFLPHPTYRAFTEDYFAMISDPLLIAIIWGYYVWTFNAPFRVIEKIKDNGVLNHIDNEFEKAIGYLTDKRPTYVSMLLAIGLTLLAIIQGYLVETVGWWNFNLISYTLGSVPFLICSFAAWSGVIRLLNNARFYRQSLRDINLHPLHPDGAGGLLPLGNYALITIVPLAVGASMIAFGLYWMIGRGEFNEAYGFHVVILLYLILTPIIFFAPLLSAHRAMLKIKNEKLLLISSEFDEIMVETEAKIKFSSKDISIYVDKTEQLNKLHLLVSNYPTWPIDATLARRTIFTFLLPVISFLASAAFDVIIGAIV